MVMVNNKEQSNSLADVAELSEVVWACMVVTTFGLDSSESKRGKQYT
jgi:hypothetical protein